MKSHIEKFIKDYNGEFTLDEATKLLCGINSPFLNENEYNTSTYFASLPRNSVFEVRMIIQDLIKEDKINLNGGNLLIKQLNSKLSSSHCLNNQEYKVKKDTNIKFDRKETTLNDSCKSIENKDKQINLKDLNDIDIIIIDALKNNEEIFSKTSLSFFLRRGKNIEQAKNKKFANSLQNEKHKDLIDKINNLIDKTIIISNQDKCLKLNKAIQKFEYSMTFKKDVTVFSDKYSDINKINFQVDEYLDNNLDKIMSIENFEEYEFIEFIPIKDLSRSNSQKLASIANFLDINFLNIFETLKPVPNKNAYLATCEDYSFYLQKKSQKLINKKILLICNLPLKDWSKEKTVRMINLLNPKQLCVYE